MRLNILTDKCSNQNSIAFIHPLIFYKKQLSDCNIDIKIFTEFNDEIFDCDFLGLSSKWTRHGRNEDDHSRESLLRIAVDNNVKTVYFDRSSSPGKIDRFALDLSYFYVKGIVYSSISDYKRKIIDNRYIAQWLYGESITSEADSQISLSDSDFDLLQKKLRLGWHTGLSNYSLLAPAISQRLPIRFQHLVAGRIAAWYKPERKRTRLVSGRMTSSHSQKAVRAHRAMCIETLEEIGIETKVVNPMSYWRELVHSTFCVSPFGTGEINYRDYEAFMAGAALIKPNLFHVETWPPLFIADETYIPVHWDFSDLLDKLSYFNDNPVPSTQIAKNAQETYRKYCLRRANFETFLNQFRLIFEDYDAQM